MLRHLGQERLWKRSHFNLAYTYKAQLKGQIILENFTLWQLGLLGFLWKDLIDGLIPVGHKQDRQGQAICHRSLEMRLTRLGVRHQLMDSLGIGALFSDSTRYGYDTAADHLEWLPLRGQRPEGNIRWEATLNQNGAEQLSSVGTQDGGGATSASLA